MEKFNNEKILQQAKQVFETEINALIRTVTLIDDNFIKAVKAIANSNKTVISGVGKSGIIGQKIAATLSSTGVSSVFLHPVEALHGDIGMVQKDDVAILISKSGNTEELVRIIPYLKMRNARIIAIVGNISSFLADNADIVLDASVEIEACPFNLAPTSSSTTTLVLGDALAVCLMYERNFSLEDFSRLHPLGHIGRTTNLRVKDVLHKKNNVAIANEDTIFKDAIIKMTKKPLGCIVIIDEFSQLLGILTDGDIRRALQNYDNILSLPVSQIMNNIPITINPTATLVEALAIMENRTNQINVLPVVENNLFIGLIRIHDILQNK